MNETVKIEKWWLEEVTSLLDRVGRDADKVVQPSRIEKDAHRLLKYYLSTRLTEYEIRPES
jgi:hypothetical protein